MSTRRLLKQRIGIVITSTLVMAVTPSLFVWCCEFGYAAYETLIYHRRYIWQADPRQTLVVIFWLGAITFPFCLLVALLMQRIYQTTSFSWHGYLLFMLFYAGGALFLILSVLFSDHFARHPDSVPFLFSGIESGILAGSIVTYAMNKKHERREECSSRRR